MAAVIPVVVPAVLRHQRRIVAALRDAGATDRSQAATVEKLAVREGPALETLLRHGIVRDAGGQLLWLDEAAWNAHEAKRWRLALRIMVGMGALVFVSLLTLWLILH